MHSHPFTQTTSTTNVMNANGVVCDVHGLYYSTVRDVHRLYYSSV